MPPRARSTTAGRVRARHDQSPAGARRELGDLGRRPASTPSTCARGSSSRPPTASRRSRDLNADDVVFSFERQWKQDHPYHSVSGGSYEYFVSVGMPDLLKAIEKVDDQTVTLRAQRSRTAPFLADLAMDFASILSAEYAEAMTDAGTPEQVDLQPVGTGPFQLVAYQKDAVIRYKAHPDYWAGKAALDDLVFAITPDASVRWQKLQAGECHVMPYPEPGRSRGDPRQSGRQPARAGGPERRLSRLQHREGAVHRQARAPGAQHGDQQGGDPGRGVPGRGHDRQEPDAADALVATTTRSRTTPTIRSGAKKLLEEAGVSDLKTNIWAMPVQRPYNPNARRMAELIQADWAKVGVEAEIVSFEWGEYLERSARRRARDRAARLDRRHRRSRQLPLRAARLRGGAGTAPTGRAGATSRSTTCWRRPSRPATRPSAPSSTRRPR